MAIASHRLLGFAFASADLLLEVSAGGVIDFAMGASEALSGSGEKALQGQPWEDFIDVRDRPMIQALFDGLEPGRRSGPVVARLAARPDGVARAASLSVFRLPENGGATSCALVRASAEALPENGELYDRASFEAAAGALMQTAQATGTDLELALVELAGLTDAREQSSPETRETLDARVAGALRAQAHGGAAATELGEDRFALVRARGEGADNLVRRLAQLMDLGLPQKLTPRADLIPLAGDEGGPRQAVRALRYTLDNFLKNGSAGVAPADLSEALTQAVQKTLQEVGELGVAIKEKRFRLVYQPVVTLKDGGLHHYETLVRFGKGESPFPLIRMAEEMDLIESLDLAILERAVEMLSATPDLKLAVNVSGRTIGSPDFITKASALIGAHPKARGRLLFELTESSALEDLAQADRHLKALRDEGCEICLDDFGAGAASLEYLQQLHLDVLKIDGRYIKDLERGGRESTFVKHLVKMCRELRIKTLAEMVETQTAEDAIREAGVDMAQGYLYGAPADTP
ncbi:MAG: EAL domain-containing protein, partial [Phenylobacterium sp.]